MFLLKLFSAYIHSDKNLQIYKCPIFSLRSCKIQLCIKTNIRLSKELSVRLAEWLYCNIYTSYPGIDFLCILMEALFYIQVCYIGKWNVKAYPSQSSQSLLSLSVLLRGVLLWEYLVVSSFLILLEQIFAYQSHVPNKHPL